MKLIPYPQLSTEPAVLQKMLAEEGNLVITVDDKPFALLIDLTTSENMDDVLIMVSRLQAQMAARAIRRQAQEEGLDAISVEQMEEFLRKMGPI